MSAAAGTFQSGTSRVPEGLEASPGVIAGFERFGPSWRWWVVLVSMAGSFSTLLAATIVNVAIPDIMGALGISLDQAQFLASGFLAAGTVTMLLTAWCMRSFGVARTFVGSMIIFIIGSSMGGLATTPEALFIARVVQGAAAGMMTPLSMVMTGQVFPPSQRGRAMGIMSVGTILAPALGPTLGGYLVDELSWRWVFWMIIPFALPTLPLALMLLPGREESGPFPRFDWIGTALACVFILGLLVAMSDSQRYGWHDHRVAITLGIGVIALILWIGWELIIDEPILDLRLLTNLPFAASVIVSFTVSMGLYGSTYLFPLFLVNISGFPPVDAGIVMAPAGFVMAFLFPVSGAIADRISPRRMIILGLLVFAWSSWAMVTADRATPIENMVWWYMVGRVGLVLIFPSLNAASLNALNLATMAQGAGMMNFMRQLGGAFGVSIVSINMTHQLAWHRDQIVQSQRWDNGATMEMLRLAQQEFRMLGQTGYQSFETSFGYVTGMAAHHGSVLAYRDGFLMIAVVFVASVVPAWFMRSRAAARPDG